MKREVTTFIECVAVSMVETLALLEFGGGGDLQKVELTLGRAKTGHLTGSRVYKRMFQMKAKER